MALAVAVVHDLWSRAPGEHAERGDAATNGGGERTHSGASYDGRAVETASARPATTPARNDGFTLVELMVAITILAIAPNASVNVFATNTSVGQLLNGVD